MAKIFLSILLTAILCSCQHAKVKAISDTKETELRTFFLETYKGIDSTIKIDSFRFVRLDTISLKEKYFYAAGRLSDRIEECTEEAKKNNELLQTELQLMRLYSGLSTSLYKNASDDFDKYHQKVSDAIAKGKGLIAKQDSLNKLATKSDSLNPVGYEAICLYQIRYKDQSIKKDTAYIVLNQEKNIVKREDFYGEDD